MTAKDFLYSFNLLKIKTHPQHALLVRHGTEERQG